MLQRAARAQEPQRIVAPLVKTCMVEPHPGSLEDQEVFSGNENSGRDVQRIIACALARVSVLARSGWSGFATN